jgi:TolB-like protein/Tfp pilus assembly protein PilF/predicted Ser/Thr protein kinase
MPLSPGDKLGPYEILSPLGSGGMGIVWKARDPRLDRVVAIKRLKGQHSARFQQEARAIAALNHPHICQIYDVGPDYLVLEYIEGAPIQGPIPAEEALPLALQIVSAMEAAHKRGILHRDLKPGNILVNESGAKLLDFGLAKLNGDGDETQTIGVSGTPTYMSPEQAEGKALDARSDIFSFGSVLYELLSGRRAFESLAAVLRDEPRALEAVPALREVVARCLKKSPAERFASAADVRIALEKAATKPAEQQPSIAVLPFANMSGDKEQEYFSDGLAEEIINELVKIPGLKVIARTSAFAFKGQNIDIRKIAETLGVAHILEGSVRRAGNRVRITGQLITAADGSHLWSERYDRELADVFAVQDEISAAIAGALRLKLSSQTAKPRHAPKLAAHEALLKARYFHWKVTPESMEQAKTFYEQAIALDPQYALAHALYADFHFGRTVMGLTSFREAAPVAKALAHRALALDPALPEAHAILCVLASTFDYDWKEAERRFQLTMSQGSVSPHCRLDCGDFYLPALGQWQEAVEQLELAVQEDPLHATMRANLAFCLSGVGRYAEAEQQIRQAIDLDTNNIFVYGLGSFFVYLAEGKLAEALSLAEKAVSLAPWFPTAVGAYAATLALTGERARGKELLEKRNDPSASVLFHLTCGELDPAADWVEKMIEERFPTIVVLLQHPVCTSLRASPRWPKLAKMMNLPG